MKNNTPKTKKVPERRCTGCGESFPKRDLIRVVRTPDGGNEYECNNTYLYYAEIKVNLDNICVKYKYYRMPSENSGKQPVEKPVFP